MKKIISLTLASLTFISFAFAAPISARAGEAPSLNVNAKAAVLMEPATGKILLAQNPHEKLPPASVTKVMTMLLIYEAVDDGKIKWDDMVTVSPHAASMGGSQIFLEQMEQQTVRDLTKSIVVASANDAAVAMAEFIAGSEEGFVLMMNDKAKELGMNDTTFKNACGLDTAGHVTSAFDIALMSRELITKYPQVFEFTKIWMDKITLKTARGVTEFGLSNTNKLIRNYSGATGLKTGSTADALSCISATAKRDGLSLISVVLGAPDSAARFGSAVQMFDYGFANYAVLPGLPSGTKAGEITVFKGDAEKVSVDVKDQIGCLVGKGKNTALTYKVELLDSLNAPAPMGTKAGEIIYYFEDKEVGRSDLVTNADVARASLRDVIQRQIRDWVE